MKFLIESGVHENGQDKKTLPFKKRNGEIWIGITKSLSH